MTESLESRLWPLPVTAVVVAVLLGVVVPRLDLLIDSELPNGVDSLVFNGGAETARSVLSSVAGSLITATSLTFSLTVVALQLASSQASPRVLRLFARDRQVHRTLGVFLGTFAYSVTVLRSVRAATDDIPEFVPRAAVTTAFVLTLVSVIVLVFFLAHLAAQLRVETILKEIHSETGRTIDLVGDSNASFSAFSGEAPTLPRRHLVRAPRSGFITSIDRPRLIDIAARHDLLFEETLRVGENVVTGAPIIAWMHLHPGGDLDDEDIEKAVRGAIAVSYERTAAQDVDYGIQQIVDIGVRALSPGINDPTTAVHALGHLDALTARWISMTELPPRIADSDGRLRLLTSSFSTHEKIHRALGQLRHYGALDPMVALRFPQAIDDIARLSGREGVREALRYQVGALERQVKSAAEDPVAQSEALQAIARTTATIAQATSDRETGPHSAQVIDARHSAAG